MIIVEWSSQWLTSFFLHSGKNVSLRFQPQVTEFSSRKQKLDRVPQNTSQELYDVLKLNNVEALQLL